MNNVSLKDMSRVVDWDDLKRINRKAKQRGYNRQLDLKKLRTDLSKILDKQGYNIEKTVFNASPLLVHEHKGGYRCEPHLRIGVYFPEIGSLQLDCDFNIWRELVPTKKYSEHTTEEL